MGKQKAYSNDDSVNKMFTTDDLIDLMLDSDATYMYKCIQFLHAFGFSKTDVLTMLGITKQSYGRCVNRYKAKVNKKLTVDDNGKQKVYSQDQQVNKKLTSSIQSEQNSPTGAMASEQKVPKEDFKSFGYYLDPITLK